MSGCVVPLWTRGGARRGHAAATRDVQGARLLAGRMPRTTDKHSKAPCVVLVWCASRPPCRTACASAVAPHGPYAGALSGSDVGRPLAARYAGAVGSLLTSPSAASASECGRLPRPYAEACG